MIRFAVLVAALTLSTTAAFAAEGIFNKTLDVQGAPTLKVGTNTGNVHVYAGSDTQIHIICRVHTEQPVLMQGSFNIKHIAGAVNGGGPTLRAETGSGSIEIR